MMKKITYKISIMLSIILVLICFAACGQKTDAVKRNAETTSFVAEYEAETTYIVVENKTYEETTTVCEAITGEINNETTNEIIIETTNELLIEEITQQNTTVQPPTTTKQKETTKKQEITTKKQQKPAQEETTSAEDVPDGTLWIYRSNIYAKDPVKSNLEQIFWNEFGRTVFSKKKNDEMVVAIVELVYDIMNNNKTDFERERALYEAICLTCNYDHESLETGLTPEGQTAYGVLIEHKAVCGGYSTTFHIALSMMGIENELITGMTTQGLHGWNIVCLDGEWYEVDVTWGDEDEGFTYRWFNLTSEEMSNTHNVSGNNCTGTKYSEKYLVERYLPEFLEDKVYLKTVDELIYYIYSQAENGIAKSVVYVPVEIWPEIDELLSDEYLLDEKYPFSDTIKNMYFAYGWSWERAPRYKYAALDGIGKIEFEYHLLENYRMLDNYFETKEEVGEYIEEQLKLGNYEISLYYNSDEGIPVAQAPEGMDYNIRWGGDFPYHNLIGNFSYVEINYYKITD